MRDKRTIHELLTTSALTVLSTAALVGIHQRYRKQQQPTARLQDYLTGLTSQLQLLQSQQSSFMPQLTRLKHACQQATQAWQQAYQAYPHGYDKNVDNRNSANHDKGAADISSAHTTTMLARPVCWVSGVASMPQTATLAGHDDDNTADNGYGVVGIDADRQIVWQTTMPERVHDIVVQPLAENAANQSSNSQSSHSQINKITRRDVVVMGRRPSAGFWVLDTGTGQLQYVITATTNRHFYGHACYSLDGKLLYVTENNTVSLAGKIGIYDVSLGYQKMAEFNSHGIGPHELIMHPDGETLVIANGGIKTEQASREELNLDTMRPSLVYLNRYDGSLLAQVIPEHNQMSVRHLAMHDDGTVMIGIQFQGEKHINVPLVLTHKRGDTDFKPLIMPNNQWQRFHQYIASVAVDSQHNLLCVTTPIGGCAAIYDLDTRELITDVRLPDCAGASVLGRLSNDWLGNDCAGFVVSDGQGQLTILCVIELKASASDKTDDLNERIVRDSQLHMMSFDNHLQVL